MYRRTTTNNRAPFAWYKIMGTSRWHAALEHIFHFSWFVLGTSSDPCMVHALKGLARHLAFWKEYSRGRFDELISGQRSRAASRFNGWLNVGSEGGAALGHRFVKEKPMWRPALATDPDTRHTTADANQVLVESSKF